MFDRALEEALAGNPRPLEGLQQAYEPRRAGCVLLGQGVTHFDAWAFHRADVMIMNRSFIRGMSEFGLLRNARHPRSNRNLANQWVEWDDGFEMWKILADGGVNLDSRNERGQTPLEEAVDYANHRLIGDLLDLGANPAALGWGPTETAKFKASLS